jgi:uncharacterized iron-regulated membrane protein
MFIGLGLLLSAIAGWWLWKRRRARMQRHRLPIAPHGFIDEVMATRRQAEAAMLAVLLERRRP